MDEIRIYQEITPTCVETSFDICQEIPLTYVETSFDICQEINLTCVETSFDIYQNTLIYFKIIKYSPLSIKVNSS